MRRSLSRSLIELEDVREYPAIEVRPEIFEKPAGLLAVFDKRVFLSVRAQTHRFLERFEVLEVRHPKRIKNTEELALHERVLPDLYAFPYDRRPEVVDAFEGHGHRCDSRLLE